MATMRDHRDHARAAGLGPKARVKSVKKAWVTAVLRTHGRWLEAGWPIHHVHEMLGHSHLSQTSTYLHATEMGLHESMRRFDAARGKAMANAQPKEPQPVGHDEAAPPSKGLLH
jgi:integrase